MNTDSLQSTSSATGAKRRWRPALAIALSMALGLATALPLAQPAAAQMVDCDISQSDGDFGSGASLQTAMNTAIANGCVTTTVTFTTGLTLSAPLTWPTSGALVFQGEGRATSVLDGNNAAANILSKGGSGALTVADMTLTNTTGTVLYATGGAVQVADSEVSDGRDGGIISLGALTITDSTIENNTGTAAGGVLLPLSGAIVITGSQIQGNTRTGSNGGGVFTNSATVSVTDSTIANNTAGGAGGGVFTNAATSITESTVTGNISNATGGGVNVGNAAQLTVTDSSITANSAGTNGAGIYATGTPAIVGSTLAMNNAGSRGGGMMNTGGAATVTNSTVTGNSATNGGGFSAPSGLNLRFSTVAGNTAGSAASVDTQSGTPTLTSVASVIASGTATDTCSSAFTINSTYTATVAGDTCSAAGTGNITAASETDMDLGTLENNGGPTLTMLPATGSPLINQVPEAVGAALTPPVTTDQRGITRTGDDWWIGAVQAESFTVTFDGNGATGGSMSAQVADAPTALTSNAYTRTGYAFAGWNTAADGSGTDYANGATFPFEADATLYAQWTSSGKAAQVPAGRCVTPGVTGRLPAGTAKRLMLPRCESTADQPIGAVARSIGGRGDVRPVRLFCAYRGKVLATQSAGYGSGYRLCRRGALMVRVNDRGLTVRVTWYAPATSDYRQYKLVKKYKS